jgi:L-aminopeptidase/D-esterase-like protein
VSADFGVLGVAVGHATDLEGATGLTVLRGVDGPLRAGAAVFGRATGSRELHSLSADHLVDRIDALMLTGGSAYGLDAAAGVMRWMEERGRGFAVGGGVVPIVPAAVVFDLAPLGRFDARPTAAMAYDACDRASTANILEGSVGAGTGATVGKIAGTSGAMKGGVGCALESAGAPGPHVGAVAVVNALGDVRDAQGAIIAGARVPGTRRASGWSFVDTAAAIARGAGRLPGAASNESSSESSLASNTGLRNTTLAAVISSVPLGRVELGQLARAAGAALFRRITPTGTTVDGDVIFALAPMPAASGESRSAVTAASGAGMAMQIEALAVLALERAIERAVRLARGRDGVPGLADDGGEKHE